MMTLRFARMKENQQQKVAELINSADAANISTESLPFVIQSLVFASEKKKV